MDEAPAPTPLRGLAWLRTVPATLFLCGLFVLVFAAEWYVWRRFGYATFVTLFIATPDPSVGWLLASLAHLPTDPRHLVSSVVQLLLFGGVVERRLGRRRFLALAAVAGLATTGAQVAWYVSLGVSGGAAGTLGASGVVLAMTALVVVDSVRYRVATGDWHGEVTWLWVFFGSVIAGQAVFGLVALAAGTAEVGVVGHLTGVAIGLGVGLARPTGAVLRSGDARYRS
ncbi:rhomboid family intramembrane serine protease [Halosimplex rubrum]|uniref:Rhomboid family intramembrane serine protease n=1 Tax=Halosimplex rubrum TaxID=869889 RepID=A0A7D5P404_9EURY|nr:rhomboid family intramembrane serine protease [Halosimplex rubrum]QLH77664.1 rhomboid family intramembrane serine protease [Halosimplex rubrum]